MEDKEKKEIEAETFSSDTADIIGNNEAGIIKQIIDQQEERDVEKAKEIPEKKKNLTLLIFGIVLTIVAIGSIFAVFIFREKIFTVEIKSQYVPMIFIDKTKFLEISDLNKDQIAKVISDEVHQTDIRNGWTEGVYLAENNKVFGLRRFLELTKSNLDKTKIDFINDNFLIGITNLLDLNTKQTQKNLFFLLKVRPASDVFGILRVWENKMFQDLHGFWGIDLNADTKYLLEKDFEDGIVQNKNARILRDTEGKIVLMYVFTGEDSFVITNNEITVQELIRRLEGSQVKR